MPIFICYRGDCDNLAQQQEQGLPLFVAQDALGRAWLCIETHLKQMPMEFLPNEVQEIMIAQGIAHRLGLSNEGTSVTYLDCPDEASVRHRLILDTYPPVGESIARLMQAGWIPSHYSWGTGTPCKLTISKGTQTFSIEGETENETYYRATQKALGERPEARETAIMPLTIQTDPVPLRIDEHGAIRIGKSQVTLDLIVREFEDGASPEEIAYNYSTLELADVYAAITYYVRHKEQVGEYVRTRRTEAERLRQEIEAKQSGRAGLREKLLARRAQMEQEHASPRL
jgi:uncharacterized protein (DUF433 family)